MAKERFRSIYEFNVIDEVKAKSLVYLLDRHTRTITFVNNMYVTDLLAEIQHAKDDDTGRYEFYVWERADEDDDGQ